MSIRIVVADDHRMLREGLVAMLSREPGFEVVGQAVDGHDAMRRVRELQPDVLVSDVAMPGLNGIEAVRRIRHRHPGVQAVCLSMHDDSRTVMGMLDAGASGYVLKDCAFEELGQAIREAMAGRTYVSPSLLGGVVGQADTRCPQPVEAMAAPKLTPREREMVQLLSEGHLTADIAERLHLSVKTVATHRENVMRKLRLRGIAELTRYALREGLSSLEVRRGAGLGEPLVSDAGPQQTQKRGP